MLLNRPCYITGVGVGGDVEVTYLVCGAASQVGKCYLTGRAT